MYCIWFTVAWKGGGGALLHLLASLLFLSIGMASKMVVGGVDGVVDRVGLAALFVCFCASTIL